MITLVGAGVLTLATMAMSVIGAPSATAAPLTENFASYASAFGLGACLPDV